MGGGDEDGAPEEVWISPNCMAVRCVMERLLDPDYSGACSAHGVYETAWTDADRT